MSQGEEALKDQARLLKRMFDEGSVGEDVFARGVLLCADELLQHQAVRDAFALVQLIGESYLTHKLLQDMLGRPGLIARVHRLALAFLEANLVQVPEPAPTQPPGRA